MLVKIKKAQSILEYAVLIGIIAAGILIMQSFVKRSFQGNLKEASDRMGEQFSASNTQISRDRTIEGDQTISEETGTATALGQGAYSINSRTGGKTTATTKQATDSATQEKYKWEDYQANQATAFQDPLRQ